MITVRNKKWDEDEFLKARKEVLARWPTGKEIDLDEALAYRKSLPRHKNMVYALEDAKKEGKIMIAAHLGHAGLKDTIEHCQAVHAAGAGYSNIATDTYTRRGRYQETEKAIQQSIKQGKSLLNGYPIVNHGLKNARTMVESVDMPLNVVDSVQEHCELMTEVGLAAGMWRSSCDVSGVLMASKDYPIEAKMKECQYQNRLSGYYEEHGSPVEVQVVVHMCGHDPPGIKVALLVLHSILVAEQGVKHIGLSPYLTAHFIQDMAMLRLSKELAEKYAKKFGYNVVFSIGTTQYAGPYPRNETMVMAVLPLLYAAPMLAGASHFHIKSPAQAIGIPGKEANAQGVRMAVKVRDFIGKQRYDEGPEFRLEKEMERLEAEAIIEKVLELGDGDPSVGQIKAVEAGVIDVPYSPYLGIKDLAYPLRDDTGAIRWFRHGNIPLPMEVVEYHKACLARRLKDSKESAIEMMRKDIYYLCMEEYSAS